MTPAAKRRLVLACTVALGLGLVAAGAFAAAVSFGSPLLRIRLMMTASAVKARALGLTFRVYDPYGQEAPVSCNCSTEWEYRCSDPTSAYMQRVRQDSRLSALIGEPAHRLETYVHYQNFLRDQFEHGEPSNPLRYGYNILERLDDAAAGSKFLCDDISRMFVELVQANEGFARLISLFDPDGSGHVVTEAWVEDVGKWVVFDPDFNVYYTDQAGIPLGARELHEIYQSGRFGDAVAHVGDSKNSAYRAEGHEHLLRHYDSVAFNRRANFDTPYPLWHPKRHAINRFSVLPTGRAAFTTLAVHEVVSDASEVYFTPCRDRIAASGGAAAAAQSMTLP